MSYSVRPSNKLEISLTDAVVERLTRSPLNPNEVLRDIDPIVFAGNRALIQPAGPARIQELASAI